MSYIGTQPNNVKQNIGLYNPSEILQLTKEGSWGGSLELIAEANHSGDVSNIDFTSIKESKYDVHILHFEKFTFESGVWRIGLQFRESGTWETGNNYEYSIFYQESTGSGGLQTQTAYPYIQYEFQTSTVGESNGYVYFYNLGNTNVYSSASVQQYMQASTYSSLRYGGGVMKQASVVDGIRIMRSGSNDFTAYELKLYGLKK